MNNSLGLYQGSPRVILINCIPVSSHPIFSVLIPRMHLLFASPFLHFIVGTPFIHTFIITPFAHMLVVTPFMSVIFLIFIFINNNPFLRSSNPIPSFRIFHFLFREVMMFHFFTMTMLSQHHNNLFVRNDCFIVVGRN